jgi:dinuclear metal center YbgI/SA1388 family protein
MITTGKLIEIMQEWAPSAHAEEWDNVGLLIGDASHTVSKVLVALDATEAVVNEAITGGFDFIITHHPLIYNPIKSITAADSSGKKIIALIKHGIGCYCAHTNLDKAPGGVNDCLAEKIGLEKLTPLIPEPLSDNTLQSFGIGRIGFLPAKMKTTELARHVKSSLNLPTIRYSGEPEKLIKKIAICGGDGSGTRYIEAAIQKGCDAYITGDLRYHCVQEALESGIVLLDITHYSGEIPIVPAIVSRLEKFVKISPSSIDGQVFSSM